MLVQNLIGHYPHSCLIPRGQGQAQVQASYPVWWQVLFLYAHLKNGTYYVIGSGIRPSICP